MTADRATAHLNCTHARTKVARAACRRAARRATLLVSLTKTDAQIAAHLLNVADQRASSRCRSTVKSGKRAGQVCGRPSANVALEQGSHDCHSHFKVNG